MAYETSGALNPNDLLVKLATFMVANGWTLLQQTPEGNGLRVHMFKGDTFVNFRSYFQERINYNVCVNNKDVQPSHGGGIMAYLSTGYLPNIQYIAQPGAPVTGGVRGGYLVLTQANIPNYYLFAYGDNDDIYMVVEYEPSRFQLLALGTLRKYSVSAATNAAWISMPSTDPRAEVLVHINGMYYSYAASLLPFRSIEKGMTNDTQSCYVRMSHDNINGWAMDTSTQGSSGTGAAASSSLMWNRNDINSTLSPYSWRTQMFPIAVMLTKDSNGTLQPYGELRNFRRLDITSYTPGEEFTLGPDTWKVFPTLQKGGYSWQHGYCLLKTD